FRRPLIISLAVTFGFSLFSDIPLNIANQFLERTVVRNYFGTKGITPIAAIIVFTLSLVVALYWEFSGREARVHRQATITPAQRSRNRTIVTVISAVVLLLLPWIIGQYISNVVDQVLTFALMALGLNIVVGFAGLLDLGYVAFFAIGAYVTALMTSSGLVVSDLLKPYIGGAQGITQVERPSIFGYDIISPQAFYYLLLAGVLLALYISSRLRDGRAGRRWMALREDEDVAEAMGIHLVNSKLMAFAIGAALAGLAGAIFASRIASVFPNSFNLLISINVLAIIIVGGLGSLPGVILGAFVLVGLPELLREFEEYRLLMYGVLLIVMMLVRPEGLWPSAVRRRELHAEGEIAEHEGIQPEPVQPLM
ncbi:MAG: hypothetical protein DCC51_17070, partial [Anaerolineae bacterium]